MNFLDLLYLIPLFPLAGFVVNGLFGKRWPKLVINTIACGSVLMSFLFSVGAVFELLGLEEERSHTNTVFEWLNAGAAHTSEGLLAEFSVNWAFLLDPLSAVMVLFVTGIGFLIHVYSTGYMAEEDGYYRYFAYLNLFMFSMLTLILGSNYLMMFIGWEGVGLCSYLLIGFYINKKSAGDAAKKAFVANRVGDWGLSIGIMMIFFTFGTLEFTGVREAVFSGVESGVYGLENNTVFIIIGLALFIGATGKSAQIPLYVWLPDAMEGPTPVSALIHAATMVTAGVYMLARSNYLYQLAPEAMMVVAVVGALTALMAASIALVQNDIKKVLAYSTVSQLGYMVLAMGVGAFAVGIFHVMTHAFFKALLFLGSGSVIHAMHHEQDMRKMGALKNKIPITFWTMAIGTVAIAGIPPFAGFFSKDEILYRTLTNPQGSLALYIVGIFVAGLTAFYMFRMLFMTFFGESRVDPHVHVHESPLSMTVPLMILAVGSVTAGWLGLPAWITENNIFEHFLEPVFEPLPLGLPEVAEHSHAFEMGLAALSVIVALIGIFVAYSMYYKKSALPARLATSYKTAYEALLNKYYVDELYEATWINGSKGAGNRLWSFDSKIVDGGVNGAAKVTVKSALGSNWWDRWIVDGAVRFLGGFVDTFSWPVRLIQTGYVQNYALMMILGVLVFVGYVLLG
jgi:NADH-quinone oxidoreductase subunit L